MSKSISELKVSMTNEFSQAVRDCGGIVRSNELKPVGLAMANRLVKRGELFRYTAFGITIWSVKKLYFLQGLES